MATMTKEQLEGLITTQVEAQVQKMGTDITASIKEQIGDTVKSILNDKTDIRKYLVGDEDSLYPTEDPRA